MLAGAGGSSPARSSSSSGLLSVLRARAGLHRGTHARFTLSPAVRRRRACPTITLPGAADVAMRARARRRRARALPDRARVPPVGDALGRWRARSSASSCRSCCWAGTGETGHVRRPRPACSRTRSICCRPADPRRAGAACSCERSGVINVAIEGQLLAGAFVGRAGRHRSPHNARRRARRGDASPAALIGLLLAVFAIRTWSTRSSSASCSTCSRSASPASSTTR